MVDPCLAELAWLNTSVFIFLSLEGHQNPFLELSSFFLELS